MSYKHIFHYVSLAQLEKAAYGEMETVLTNQRGTLYYLSVWTFIHSQEGNSAGQHLWLMVSS